MIIIGLCGRSGSGKSTVASIFESAGIPVLDADRIYHDILAQKGACVVELVKAFGKEILSEDGNVNRRALAKAVFMASDAEDKQKLLNSITHKHVLDRVKVITQEYEKQDRFAVLLDVPLLFESGFDACCDYVVSVIADEEIRLSRLALRDGLSQEELKARMHVQKDDVFLREHSDFVIENNGDKNALFEAGRQILEKIHLGEKK